MVLLALFKFNSAISWGSLMTPITNMPQIKLPREPIGASVQSGRLGAHFILLYDYFAIW